MPETSNYFTNNPELLLKRITTAFPELAGSKYVYITEGWDHEVMILNDAIVFRFPDDDDYLKQLSKEILILAEIKPLLSVAIPEYAYVARDKSFAGYPLVRGESLSKEVFDGLGGESRTMIAKQLGGFLTALHTMKATDHPFISNLNSYMEEDQNHTKDLANSQLKQVLSSEDYALVVQMLADTDKLLAQSLPSVFIHGDIYNRHLLWDRTTTRLGVIDFSDMGTGDPAIDFSELYEYGLAFVEEVYGYYRGIKDDTFLNRAWTYQQWLSVYMMIDYFDYQKTSFEVARQDFDRVKLGIR